MSFFVEQNPFIFVILTVILGGGAAFMAGRNLAASWKSPWLLFIYMLIFTCGVRFLHFALFQDELTSLQYYISHGLIIQDRKSTRLNSSHPQQSRMPSSA